MSSPYLTFPLLGPIDVLRYLTTFLSKITHARLKAQYKREWLWNVHDMFSIILEMSQTCAINFRMVKSGLGQRPPGSSNNGMYCVGQAVVCEMGGVLTSLLRFLHSRNIFKCVQRHKGISGNKGKLGHTPHGTEKT